MDLDVDKNKVKLEDSNFINGFVKAEPIKDDAYMSELFYKETEKYFNEVERVKPDEKMNILLGLTYEIKENSGKEFSIEDFAQIYLPPGTEEDYLNYLREKGVSDYFYLKITYEIKENSGKEFSIEDFAQIYLPPGTEEDYLNYLREKGVSDYFYLKIKNRIDRQLKVRGANVKVDAALLDDPNKVRIVKRGNEYDLVIF